MKRKILSILISAAIVFSITACGTQMTPPAAESTAPPAPSSSVPPADSEPAPEADSESADTELNILARQAQREQDIFSDYKQGTYTFAEPYVIGDPYELNPLSALVLFETTPDVFTVTVAGGSDADTVQYECKITDSRAEIPF